mgnify:CR=1 FL=1
MVHVKRRELNEGDVEGYAEVMRHEKRKHVVSKGNPEVRETATKKQKKKIKKMVSTHRLHDGVREAGQTPNQKA